MASEMGVNVFVTLLWSLIAITKATEVELTSSWKPELGWEMVCSWKLLDNDSLQSVRLYDNKHQFYIYRSEVNSTKGTHRFPTPQRMMEVNCEETAPRGVVGSCVLTLELYQPPSADFPFTCEVSGERPWFRIDKKDLVIEAFVAPSEAKIISQASVSGESSRVVLNCTTHGLPEPSLKWAIGDQNVPEDFVGRRWNFTSKLWDVWSQLSYTPSDRSHLVSCTPEGRRGSQLVKGKSAEYNAASTIYSTITTVVVTALGLVLLS